jgi:hypothetical protein
VLRLAGATHGTPHSEIAKPRSIKRNLSWHIRGIKSVKNSVRNQRRLFNVKSVTASNQHEVDSYRSFLT